MEHQTDARDFLERHGITEALKEAVREVLASRPSDPVQAIGQILILNRSGAPEQLRPMKVPTRPASHCVDSFGTPVADPTPKALPVIGEYQQGVLLDNTSSEHLAAVVAAADATTDSALLQLLAADFLLQQAGGTGPAGNERLEAAVAALGGRDTVTGVERRPPIREAGYLQALRATAVGDHDGAYDAWLGVVAQYPADLFAARRALTATLAYPIDLGTSYTQPVLTQGPCAAAAQHWFDCGCVWLAAYHREEACFCFRQASKADPRCAMAFWGIALTNGPDYNFSGTQGFYSVAAQPEGYPSLQVAQAAIERALGLLETDGATYPGREVALIGALSMRYEWPVTAETILRQEAYADAMAKVAEAFPTDADIHAVHAEAILCLSPWDLYEKGPNASAGSPNWRSSDAVLKPVGVRAEAALAAGLAACPNHVWLCHLKIHLCEMGPVSAFDWDAAEHVRSHDALGAGHLVHMPTHLDFQVGAYAEAVRCNVKAYEADLKLYRSVAAGCPSRFGIYTGYVVHNMEFAVWAAMYGAQFQAATAAASEIDGFLTPALLKSFPHLPTFFEAYAATPLMVLVRFGRWQDILDTPYHEDRELHLAHTLFLHYAQGLAHGVLGDLTAARACQEQFAGACSHLQMGGRLHHNVDMVLMAEIAGCVLDGEILYREGSYDRAFEKLEEGIRCFDALPYDEPHGWLMSVRQTLAALLTEQGQHAKAVGLYLEDLELFPQNPWSLAGLVLCYKAIGETAELADTKELLSVALCQSDFKVSASCACATSHWGGGSGCGDDGRGKGCSHPSDTT